jgi:hypothetical protein
VRSRLLRYARAVWLQHFITDPPKSLASLERLVGELEVDFAGHEGFGSVVRPSYLVPRGRLRPEVRTLFARFGVDIHHTDPHRPRDMPLGSVELGLDIGHATVARLLAAQLGPGREIAAKRVIEHGRWFYLDALADASAHLVFEWQRPVWAIPPPLDGAREHLLDALMDRLVTDTELAQLTAAIEPLVIPALGALNTLNEGRIYISFRPGLPIELVLGVLHWDAPVVASHDTHMTSWTVYPDRPYLESRGPHAGPWYVEVSLDGPPRTGRDTMPALLRRAGYYDEYDARALTNTVTSLGIYKPR